MLVWELTLVELTACLQRPPPPLLGVERALQSAV